MINVLDHGYVKLIESWGDGEAGVAEAGIIEAARQSTQGSFRGWNVWHCQTCGHNFDGKFEHFPDGNRKYDRTQFGITCLESWSNDEKLLGFMYNNGHLTPFEFAGMAGMVMEIQAPILVFCEWHRHRTQSYNEMSARYAPLPVINYLPTMERLFLTQEKNKQAQAVDGAPELTEESAKAWLAMVTSMYEQAESTYQAGLSRGIPKEIARIVLPVGRYSRMRVCVNLRNWLQFLTLRMNPNAQYEIRMYANVVGQIISGEFPKTWKLFESKAT